MAASGMFLRLLLKTLRGAAAQCDWPRSGDDSRPMAVNPGTGPAQAAMEPLWTYCLYSTAGEACSPAPPAGDGPAKSRALAAIQRATVKLPLAMYARYLADRHS
eukprot:CAMPEP_0117677922 /NCGR_PEP_ID=MMETSP0804-20121206/17000_1 /TAXON_ID=1074897 /ORGANISM="Tetraselmis astigmatica, Strain CCMP880" /LENGTH=103 /DNA_ID=CAMNT_0005487231 /DNA_START=140 /DNA_END=448 /DNA_ORIENTATION=+